MGASLSRVSQEYEDHFIESGIGEIIGVDVNQHRTAPLKSGMTYTSSEFDEMIFLGNRGGNYDLFCKLDEKNLTSTIRCVLTQYRAKHEETDKPEEKIPWLDTNSKEVQDQLAREKINIIATHYLKNGKSSTWVDISDHVCAPFKSGQQITFNDCPNSIFIGVDDEGLYDISSEDRIVGVSFKYMLNLANKCEKTVIVPITWSS